LLAISTSQSLAPTWLAPRLGAFQVQNPDLAVRLSADNNLIDFSTGEFHAAIRIGRGDWPGLKAHFLFRSHVTPICSPAFRDRHDLRDPEQLLDVPRLSSGDRWWADWMAMVGVAQGDGPPRPGIRLDNQVLEANAALAGSGVAMMTPMFWRAELDGGRLVQPFPQLLIPPSSHWLVYPETRRGQRKIGAFREWLLAEIAREKTVEPAEIFREPWAERVT
jgi:LysR family transcriptional regulator, glycine cleavage system transcriptional activator